MPSPAFTFTGSVNKYQATAGGSVVATLSSLTGVSSVAWSIVGTDETSGSYAIVTSGTLGSVATITAGAAGTAAILKCTINGGINGLGQPDTSYSTTRKWWVPATGTGLEVACAGENAESSAAYGWTGIVNSAVRNVASGGVTAVTASAPIVSSGGASPAISITAASSVAAGSMSAADKAKVDALLPASIAADQVVITDGSGVLSGTNALTSTQLSSATADLFLAVEGAGGTLIASSGDVRLSETSAVKARNLADTSDASVIAFGVGVADTVELGDAGYDLKAEGLSVGLNAVSSRVELQCAGSAVFAAHPTYVAQSVDTYEFAATTTPAITQAAASGNGTTLTVSAQSSSGGNGNGGAVVVHGGTPDGTGVKGPVRIALGTGTPEPMVEVVEVATGRRAIVLGLGAAITSTELPAGTGDRVVYVANYATAPTANPVSGQLLYAGGHAMAARSTSGVTTDLAPIGTSGGFSTKHWHHQQGRVLTNDATFTTAVTITIPQSSASMLTAYIVGKRTDVEGNVTTAYSCASIKRTGAAAPVVNSTHTVCSHEDDNSTDWRWSVSGNDVVVQVQGVAAQRYEWSVHVTGNIGAI